MMICSKTTLIYFFHPLFFMAAEQFFMLYFYNQIKIKLIGNTGPGYPWEPAFAHSKHGTECFQHRFLSLIVCLVDPLLHPSRIGTGMYDLIQDWQAKPRQKSTYRLNLFLDAQDCPCLIPTRAQPFYSYALTYSYL